MNFVKWPTLATLACACVLAAGCDRRDNSVPPPMPQTTTPSTTMPSTSGGMGSTAPSDTASAPGMGASMPGTAASN